MAESNETVAPPTAVKSNSGLGPRVITGVIGAVIAIGLTFSPSDFFFIGFLALCLWAASEFAGVVRHLAPTAPLRSLWVWIPAAALGGYVLLGYPDVQLSTPALFALAYGLIAVPMLVCLFQTGGEPRDAAIGMGLITLAIPYFAIPPIAAYWVHKIDPWLVLLVIAIVAIGDTAAYFGGRAFGRHLLAPRVSPKKTWEGSVAGFTGSLLTTVVWCQVRLGDTPPKLLAVAAVTAVMAQLGDLVESQFKRGAGVKDSAQVLPGHGGFYDRLDAMLLGAPAFAVGLWWIGPDLIKL
ncbi:MAG: phosphatidate cytidylyltransferase [Acidobacteriota bacterium]